MYAVDKQSGSWSGQGEYFFDLQLAEGLLSFLREQKVKAIADFGAGAQGIYTKFLISNGILCEGFDGNPDSAVLSPHVVTVCDLSVSVNLHKKWDWVMSLECGEHIPPARMKHFIDNVHTHAEKGIIVSWAVPGQDGIGHFNELPNETIEGIFLYLGFWRDRASETFLRKMSTLPWFKNTIMVYRRH